jgi:site-specific DNA-methyltransferase (adenine-specific)
VHELHHGNCLDILRTMPDCSIDAVVTDPPYGLSFMGKKWDYDVPSTEIWAECLRVLKPGGYLLAFAGTRTQHRMAVRIEDAGFEIRDMLAWMYGSGFPKSHNLNGEHEGWGTALKPAMEPITMARKPFKATVAQNVQEWGTGAINIDGCRIGEEEIKTCAKVPGKSFNSLAPVGFNGCEESTHLGRWPANVMHDGSAEILQGMGEAARFFYTPKACKDDRDDGCEMMEERWKAGYSYTDTPGNAADGMFKDRETLKRNFHPTVKPTDLMRYLCRMVTPTGGIVLDPFTGSGSTGRGAVLEGFRFIGCEMDADYIEIAKARILAAEKAYQPCLTFD